MNGARAILKALARRALHPLRKPVTWGCQHGFLSTRVQRFLPWRWALEPFTIYGVGWTCQWAPTEFDAIGQRMFWSGLREWEKETAPVVLQNIARSRCFIDVGANCGFYTVAGCALNHRLHVVAVEPVPRTFGALQNNVARNDFASRVTTLNMALGDSDGTVPFHEADDATMSSLDTAGYWGQSGRVIEVACRTLDSVVEELGVEPDFMKIDVEGFEAAVLSGATRVLDRFRPRIVLEANPGDPADRVTEILSRHGYSFRLITNHGLEGRPAIVPDDQFRNWLCLPG